MTWNPALTRLRDLLAELYPAEPAARQVVAEAGLPSGSIHFSTAAIENWHNILTQAARHDQVRAIVDVACRDFPNRAPALQQASDQHHRQASSPGLPIVRAPAGDDALPASLRIDPDDPPYAVLRQLLTDAFSPQDLQRFCLDRADLRGVTTRFAPGDGLIDMVDKLLEYCRTHLLWDQLLAALAQERPAQVFRAFGVQAQAAAPRPGPLPAPMTATEIETRHQADVERGRPHLDHAVRLIPKAHASSSGTLGPAGRDYVVVGDYEELRYRPLLEIRSSLWAGTDAERESWDLEQVAVVFEVGARYQDELDLKAGTWQAVFWILACRTRLDLFRMTAEQQKEMGRGPGRNYFRGQKDQVWWYEQLLDQLKALQPPQTVELLEKRLGVGDACFEGKGISAGDPKCRLFLVKNLPLKDLNYQIYDLGTPQDNRALP